MLEFRPEPLVVSSVSGLLPEGERDRRVALTSFHSSGKESHIPMREVVCYECGKVSQVPAAALSAHCQHCQAHLNMADVEIRPGSEQLTIRTLGDVTVPSETTLSRLSVVCRNMEIDGHVSGSFRCTRALVVNESVQIDNLRAGRLVVSKGTEVVITKNAQVDAANIYGKLTGVLRSGGVVKIYGTGEVTGLIFAADVVMEPGAVYNRENLR